MRVSGPVTHSLAASGRGADRSGGSSAFPVLGGPAAATVSGSAAAVPAAAPGLLLAVQCLPDATARRRRAVSRGRDMLDRLELLELGLLEGNVPPSVLVGLQRSLAEDVPDAGDPGLRSLLAEIEVRVAVELAKLGPTAMAR